MALLFMGLVATHGYEEAEARAVHGGMIISGGGSITTLTPWTITELSGSGQTNIPIEVPVTFSAAGGSAPFLSSDAIQVYDSDGVTVIPVQETHRCTDLAGPDIRKVSLVCILPTLTANQARQLTIKKVASTSPATGTDVTAAEIIATGFTCPAVMAHNNGTTYTADVATGLSASTWTNKTTACNKGKWLTGGGLATSYIVTVPFKNGATAAPDNITLWAEVTAYKAQRSAVSGGNPIIAVRVQYWIKSSYVQKATGYNNHWYDLTTTCGTNSQAWVGSSPAKTLTVTGNGNRTDVTLTVPTATFTADSVGTVVADGTGCAVIHTYNSPTSVVALSGFAFASSSITSGNWRIYGVNQQYGAEIPRQEIWYGGTPAITTQPNIDSSIGVAWNGGTLTGGPFPWLVSTKMILPYSTAASAYVNNMSKLNACGANPTGPGIPGFIGDWTAYMPTTGGRGDIAPVPEWYVGGLIRYDSNGKRRIMGNATKFGLYPIFYVDENTGKSPAFNNGIDWNTEGYPWLGTIVPIGDSYHTGGVVQEISRAIFQVAHHPGVQGVPIMLSGDYYWVEQLHNQVFILWAANNPGYTGYQANRLFCTNSELRGNGWCFRDLLQAILFTPDGSPACLSYTRSQLQAILGVQFTAIGSGTPGVPDYPGINIGLVNNTGSGKTYDANGYRSMNQLGGGTTAQWQLGYGVFAFMLSRGMGMVTGDCATFVTWLMEGMTGAAVNANVVPNWCIPQYGARVEDNTGTPVKTWADVYRWSAFDLLTGAAYRIITGTGITLSGLSGSGITVTMPAGYFTAGGSSFYPGCPVVDLNAASFQIAPLTKTSVAPFDPHAYSTTVDVVSGNAAVPTNAGTVKVWNTGSFNVYVKLSVGPGTATTGDTLITPGNYVKLTTGANTYLNFIASGGYGALDVFGSIGASYAISDTITVTLDNLTSNFTVNTTAQFTVSDVGALGDVVSVTITNQGAYTALVAGSWGSTGDIISQTATSGAGTGFTYRAVSTDYATSADTRRTLRFGTAMVTGVAGNVLTLTTSGSLPVNNGHYNCYPFAQTGLVTNKIRTGAPAPGDSNGLSSSFGDPYMPTPYTGGNDYWQISKNTLFMANQFSYPNAAAAYAVVANDYTGTSEIIWKVS